MSLPGMMGIDLDNLPTQVPYWSIPPEVVVPKLTSQKKPKIGLVWTGSPSQKINHHRSIKLETMLSLAEFENAEFYSLQLPLSKQDKQQLEKNKIINLEQEMVSYAHTGALLQQMDLVISVCTSVAHLSASLGKPTWVLLSSYSDWRWLDNREDSPWYPQVRLFRQQRVNDWSDVVDNVKSALNSHFQK